MPVTLNAVRELLATDADAILLEASTASRDSPSEVREQILEALEGHLQGRKVVVILTQPQITTVQEKLEENRQRSLQKGKR